MYDVVIIGSGVMGMSVARALSEYDMRIAVIDRDIPGMHASYKAGGMLGAQNEFIKDSSLFHIARKSQLMFPDLSEQLLDEVAIDIEYLKSGLIKVNATASEAAQIREQYQFLKKYNDAIALLSEHRVSTLTNGNVDINGRDALHIPDDYQVNTNRYTKALLQSITHRKVQRYYKTEVTSIDSISQGYKVSTQESSIYGKKVLVAGGAWSSKLLSSKLEMHQVTGVKGEALLVEHPNLAMDNTLFITNGCYIIPKMKQRFMIGATSYFDDFSVGVSKSGQDWLVQQAIKYIPKLEESRLIHKWSGVRPYCKDEHPVMDEVDKGLFVITGHYRNGILLSPYIGALMSEWIVKGKRPDILSDFKIERSAIDAMYY